MANACFNAVTNPVKGLIVGLVGGRELKKHEAERVSERVNVFLRLKPHVFPSTVDTSSTYMNR